MSEIVGYLLGQVGEMSGLRVAIPAKGLVIGRDPKEADLVITHPLVSRKHAQVASDKDGKLYLIDLQSRNGTFVNDHKLSAPVPLQPNDKIEFGVEGKVVFLFESAETTSVSGVLKEAFGETVAPVEWKVGDTILGIYEVTGLLGQGGFGKVYKVHHKNWNMDLAVKSPLPELFADEKAVENFIREAETWVNLNLHSNIVQCHYVRTIGGIPRIFAEYVPGGTLASWIKNRKLRTLDQILDVAIQFAWGLHAAHEQGIVHQDVKPLNVLMTPDGVAKVSDFGLARSRPVTGNKTIITPNNMVTMAGGTAQYASPEQARGEKLSRKTDIWSWAVSVLEMFTGGIVWQNGLQAPSVLQAYQGLFGPKFIVGMPKEIAKLLGWCLQPSPDKRPSDVLEVADEFCFTYETVLQKTFAREEPSKISHAADSLNNRAVSLLDLGREREAVTLWTDAKTKEPGHPQATYNLLMYRWHKGEITDSEVLEGASETLRLLPDTWISHLLLGLIQAERADFNAAESALHKSALLGAPKREMQGIVQLVSERLRDSRGIVGVLPGHDEGVEDIDLSLDNTLIVSLGTEDQVLRVWDWQAQLCQRSLNVGSSRAHSIRISPDNTHIATAHDDHCVKIWDLRDGKLLCVLNGHSQDVFEMQFSNKGDLLVSEDGHGELRLWSLEHANCLDIAAPEESLDLETDFDCTSSMLFLRTFARGEMSRFQSAYRAMLRPIQQDIECLLYTTDANDEVVFKHAERNLPRGKDPIEHYLEVDFKLREAKNRCFALTKSGRFVAIGDSGTLRVADLQNRQWIATIPAHYEKHYSMYRLWLREDATQSVSVGSFAGANCIRVWDVGKQRCLYSAIVQQLTFPLISQDGTYAVSAEKNGRIVVQRIAPDARCIGAPAQLSQMHSLMSLKVATERYNKAMMMAHEAYRKGNYAVVKGFIISARDQPGYNADKEALKLWRALYSQFYRKTFVKAWEAPAPDRSDPSLVAWQSIGDNSTHIQGRKFLWSKSKNRVVGRTTQQRTDDPDLLLCNIEVGKGLSLRDVQTGHCIVTFKEFDEWTNWVFSAMDCRFLIAVHPGMGIKLWDLSTGHCLRTLPLQDRQVDGATLSPDGQRLAILTGWSVFLTDLRSKETVRLYKEGVDSGGACVSWSADGELLVVGQWGGIALWEAASGQLLRKFETGGCEVRCARLSLDERFLVSGGSDHMVRLWDVATGQCLWTFAGHQEGITDVGFNPDCAYIVSRDVAGIQKLWQIDWTLDEVFPAESDEREKRLTRFFARIHTPYALELPVDRFPTELEVTNCLVRRGIPSWTEKELHDLLLTLRCAGCRSRRPEQVLDKIKNTVFS